jgi:hypothetical protein
VARSAMTEQVPFLTQSYPRTGWGHWGDIGATSPPSVRDNSGHERSVNTPAQQLSPVSTPGHGHQPIRPRTEEVA